MLAKKVVIFKKVSVLYNYAVSFLFSFEKPSNAYEQFQYELAV